MINALHGGTSVPLHPSQAGATRERSTELLGMGPAPVPQPTTVPALDDSGIASAFPVHNLAEIPTPSSAGEVFRLDNGFLDGLRLNVRRIETVDGLPGYSIQFKIAGPSRPAMDKRLPQKGAENKRFEFLPASTEVKADKVFGRETAATGLEIDGTGVYSHCMPDTASSAGLRLKGQGWRVDYVPSNGVAALRGQMRLRLVGDDETCRKSLAHIVNHLGLQPAFALPSRTSLRRFALMKLLWRTRPSAAAELIQDRDLTSVKPQEIEAKLSQLGVGEARMNALRYQEVAPGHFAVMDDTTVDEMKAAGFRYAFSTVQAPEHVLSILESGQKATVTRFAEGQFIEGISSRADLGTGGAQGVFSRLVTKSAHTQYWTGRRYKIALKPELLARTDIWGWHSDFFGRSWSLTERNFGAKLAEDANGAGQYKAGNEIVSPFGNGPEWIAAVVATSEADRKVLIDHLEAAGYNPPSGKSIQEFVVLCPTIDAELLAKV